MYLSFVASAMLQVNPSITSDARNAIKEEVKDWIKTKELPITSLYWQEYKGVSVASLDEPIEHLAGTPVIQETLLGKT
jgi:hypothetical protein